jgi:hypothetical protein
MSISVSAFENPLVVALRHPPDTASLPIRAQFLHCKCAGQMPDFADFPVFLHHLRDLKTDFHRRIFQQAHRVERRPGKQPALLRRSPPAPETRPVLWRARFDLDKPKEAVLAKNQINLAARPTEIGPQNFLRPRLSGRILAARSPISPRRKSSGLTRRANHDLIHWRRFVALVGDEPGSLTGCRSSLEAPQVGCYDSRVLFFSNLVTRRSSSGSCCNAMICLLVCRSDRAG